MKEMLTFWGINVDVLTVTKVSADMLMLETQYPLHISKMIGIFWSEGGVVLCEDTNA